MDNVQNVDSCIIVFIYLCRQFNEHPFQLLEDMFSVREFSCLIPLPYARCQELFVISCRSFQANVMTVH
jgi:hypothetical protein